mgnify:CR=1 FL=1
MSFFAFAKIEVIQESSKGYTKLILSSPIPWRHRYLSFNVWHKAKLYHGDKAFKVDDDVSVEYRPGKFDRLVSLEPASLDACVICHSLYEVPPNTQKMDCGSCSVFDADRRERVPTELKLISITYKDCAFSKGCCLTFVDEAADILYFAWSFEKKPHYATFGTLETLRNYNVCGWVLHKTDDGNFVIELTHVPDICE